MIYYYKIRIEYYSGSERILMEVSKWKRKLF